MPRVNNPIDGVLRYFETADVAAAEVALHMAKRIIKGRQSGKVTALPTAAPARVTASGKKVKAKPAPATSNTVQADDSVAAPAEYGG